MRVLSLIFTASLVAAFTPGMERTFRSLQSVATVQTPQPLARGDALSITTEDTNVLTETELPLYTPDAKEAPKVLGGLKIGLREIVVITGASSGLGLATAVSLAKTGKYFIVMAVRDVEKAKKGKFRSSYTLSFSERKGRLTHPSPFHSRQRAWHP